MTKPADTELLAVAKLGAPRGLKGALKLYSYSGEYAHLEKLKTVLAVSAQNFSKAKTLAVKASESGPWGISMVFEGYETPEKAKELTGMELFAPREAASPLKPNEYYIKDLVGLKLIHKGEELGEIVGVLEGGADPLLEARPAVGLAGSGGAGIGAALPGAATVLIPFRSEFVGQVDLEAGSIELLARWLFE